MAYGQNAPSCEPLIALIIDILYHSSFKNFYAYITPRTEKGLLCKTLIRWKLLPTTILVQLVSTALLNRLTKCINHVRTSSTTPMTDITDVHVEYAEP